MYNYPYVRPGLFSKLFSFSKGFNWTTFLDGTQKTLGVINQAIPIVYQVKPILNNARTMFKIADEIRKPPNQSNTNSSNINLQNQVNTNINKPTFYM